MEAAEKIKEIERNAPYISKQISDRTILVLAAGTRMEDVPNLTIVHAHVIIRPIPGRFRAFDVLKDRFGDYDGIIQVVD